MPPTEPHDCLDHLETERASGYETHGLSAGPYEHYADEWERCAVCGCCYDPRDVVRMYEERNAVEVGA